MLTQLEGKQSQQVGPLRQKGLWYRKKFPLRIFVRLNKVPPPNKLACVF